jgi:hypothetical protein
MSSTSTFSSSSSDGGVPTSAVPSSSSRSGTSSSATLLFSFLVVFVALFTAFLLLGFFWTVRRGRRQEMLLEFDEAKGAYKGVPEMWEVWIQDEPSGSQWEWEKIRVSLLRPSCFCFSIPLGNGLGLCRMLSNGCAGTFSHCRSTSIARLYCR